MSSSMPISKKKKKKRKCVKNVSVAKNPESQKLVHISSTLEGNFRFKMSIESDITDQNRYFNLKNSKNASHRNLRWTLVLESSTSCHRHLNIELLQALCDTAAYMLVVCSDVFATFNDIIHVGIAR